MLLKFKNKVKLLTIMCSIMTVFCISQGISSAKELDLVSYKDIIRETKPEGGLNLIIASDQSYADSLSAINLVDNNRRLFLVRDAKSFAEFMDNEYVNSLIIVGGEKTINSNILKNKDFSISKYVKVTRIAGKDRYETNKLVENHLQKEKKTFTVNKIAVSGENFADAISSVNLAKGGKYFVKLIPNGYRAVDSTIKYTIGGERSVKNTYGTRIAGADRYETNDKVLKLIPDYKYSESVDVVPSSFNKPLMAVNYQNKYIRFIKKYGVDVDTEIISHNRDLDSARLAYKRIQEGETSFGLKVNDANSFISTFSDMFRDYYMAEGFTVSMSFVDSGTVQISVLTSNYKNPVDSSELKANKEFIKDHIVKTLKLNSKMTTREILEKTFPYIHLKYPYNGVNDENYVYNSVTQYGVGTCTTYASINSLLLRSLGKNVTHSMCYIENSLHIVLKFLNDYNEWEYADVTVGSDQDELSNALINYFLFNLEGRHTAIVESGKNCYKYNFAEHAADNLKVLQNYIIMKRLIVDYVNIPSITGL